LRALPVVTIAGREPQVVTTRLPPAAPSPSELRQWVVKLARGGDREAFSRLFAHFAPRLLAFFAKSGLPRDAAEEVMQETMIAVWRKASLYDPAQAGVSTWVFTIARNCRIDRLRRDGRRSRMEFDAVEAPGVDLSGEDHVIADQRDARVRDAVNALPDEQARVLRLSFFSDKPHSEIARELGIPLGTVKSRLRLGMLKIRAAWERES
jgi:RNA polymerase sigma-70 factor (ECF subfamily)